MVYSREVEATDADLAREIAAAAPGEAREAEGELYRRLAPRVRLYGLRHLRDEQAAADLMQQVLLMTIESLRAGRVRDPEKLASFVLGAARGARGPGRGGSRNRTWSGCGGAWRSWPRGSGASW